MPLRVPSIFNLVPFLMLVVFRESILLRLCVFYREEASFFIRILQEVRPTAPQIRSVFDHSFIITSSSSVIINTRLTTVITDASYPLSSFEVS